MGCIHYRSRQNYTPHVYTPHSPPMLGILAKATIAAYFPTKVQQAIDHLLLTLTKTIIGSLFSKSSPPIVCHGCENF